MAISATSDFEEALSEADVVMMLRVQRSSAAKMAFPLVARVFLRATA